MVSIKVNRSPLFSTDFFLTKTVFSSALALVQTTMENLTQIFCVARSLSSFRLARDASTYFRDQMFNGTIKMPLEPCEMQFKNTEQENIHLPIIADKLFDYGRRLVAEFIQHNAPEILQESELLRVIKSAIGLPQCEKCSCSQKTEGIFDNDSIASALWHFGEESWRGTTEKLSLYNPEKMFHSAVELVQERIKDVMTSNYLVSHISEARGYLSATTQTIRSEAEILSQLLCERRDHTLANMTEFWQDYCENHTTLETLYSLVNDCIFNHVNCEGLELFLEYLWTTKPEYYELDLLAMNYPQVDDDGFHFMVQERVPRRSVLFIGRK